MTIQCKYCDGHGFLGPDPAFDLCSSCCGSGLIDDTLLWTTKDSIFFAGFIVLCFSIAILSQCLA